VTRALVEAHGGQIAFRSASGAGSTFWFELPALTTAEARR
jgi:signal transduction histidine kinase